MERGDACAAPPDWNSAHSPPPPPPGATLRLPLAVTNASQSSPLEAALREAHPFKSHYACRCLMDEQSISGRCCGAEGGWPAPAGWWAYQPMEGCMSAWESCKKLRPVPPTPDQSRGLCKSGTHQTHHRTSLHNAQLCKQSQAALGTREAAAFVRGCAAAPELHVWQRRRQHTAQRHKAAKQRTVPHLTASTPRRCWPLRAAPWTPPAGRPGT